MGLVKSVFRGDVFYVALPAALEIGAEQRTGRPAVVVSNNIGNQHSSIVEVVYLTRQEKSPLPTHVVISTGLLTNSTVLCEQITTVSTTRLGDKVTALPQDVMVKIDNALLISLGLGTGEFQKEGHICTCGDSEDTRDVEFESAQILALAEEKVVAEREAIRVQNMYDAVELELAVVKQVYEALVDRLIRRLGDEQDS